jgi:proteasome lid subunit RPN8/RPN11
MENLVTRKKFEIVKSEPPYEPAERRLADFVTIRELSADFRSGGACRHHLYLTNEAMSHIASHIGWGKMTQHNCIEQGGILLGEAFRDPETGITYGIVNAAIAGLSARGSSVHLEMSHDTWREMLDSADRLLEESPHKELHVIGWYHTHPNGLDVFMSGTDRETQRRMFGHEWQFAIVMNPQKSQWRAFYGAAAEECRGFVIAEEAVKPPGTGETKPALDEGVPSTLGEEISSAITEDQLINAIYVSPKPAPRRRGKNNLGRLLKLCFVLLCMIVLFQLATIGLLSAELLWTILR